MTLNSLPLLVRLRQSNVHKTILKRVKLVNFCYLHVMVMSQNVVLFVLLDVVDVKYLFFYTRMPSFKSVLNCLLSCYHNHFSKFTHTWNFVCNFLSYTLCTWVFSSWRVFSPNFLGFYSPWGFPLVCVGPAPQT